MYHPFGMNLNLITYGCLVPDRDRSKAHYLDSVLGQEGKDFRTIEIKKTVIMYDYRPLKYLVGCRELMTCSLTYLTICIYSHKNDSVFCI